MTVGTGIECEIDIQLASQLKKSTDLKERKMN